MSTPPRIRITPKLTDPRIARLGRTRLLMGAASGAVTTLVLIALNWAEPTRCAYIVGCYVFYMAGNALFTRTVVSGPKHPNTVEFFRGLFNVTVWIATAHVVGWAVPVWSHIITLCVFAGGLVVNRALLRVLVFLGLWNVAAIVDGAPWQLVPVFTSLGIFVYLVAAARTRVIESMLQEAAQQNAQLRAAQAQLSGLQASLVANETLASIGMLASGVAHEINNPMTFITMNVKELAEALTGLPSLPEPLQEFRDDVLPATLDGIRRVNSIVADLRRFARGEQQERVPFDPVDEVSAAIRMASAQAASGQMIHADLQMVPRVLGAPRQISQVVLNLLLNGLQSLEGEGEVYVSTREQDGEVLVEVRDTGRGMSPETVQQLFQPFFTTKPQGEGTGLGLAVAHGIVADHGGRIRVRSDLKHGSVFTLHLPAMKPAPQEVPSPSAGAGAGAA